MIRKLRGFFHLLKASKPLQAILSSVLVVLIYSIGAFAMFQTVNTDAVDIPKPHKDAVEKPLSPRPTPSITTSPSPSPHASTSPSASPAPTTTAAPKKSSSKGSGQLDTSCMQRLNAGYVKYNSDLAAENREHQAALSDIETAHANGEYPDEESYQSDLDDENATWENNTAVINQQWQDVQSANHC